MSLRQVFGGLGGLGVLGVLVLGSGCHERAAFRDPELSAPLPIDIPEVPQTSEQFLAALLSMPFETVQVDYDVRGPGGIEGQLQIIAQTGGFRRETWSLSMPAPSSVPLALEGATIRTPRWTWTDAVEGAPQLHAVQLGPLADAFAALDSDRQDRVYAQIRAWNADLVRARDEHPGQRDVVLGQSCLVTHVVGHSICVWEETALPLQYTSEAFTVTARAIERNAKLEGEPFAIPPGGLRAPDDARDFDATGSLARLEAGDLTEIARLTVPSFGLARGR